MAMRCAAQPDTVARHRTATGAWMELRHSRVCGTTWARTWGGRVGDRIEMTGGGHTHDAEVGNAVEAESYVYTLMTVTAPGAVVRACIELAGENGSGTGEEGVLRGAGALTRGRPPLADDHRRPPAPREDPHQISPAELYSAGLMSAPTWDQSERTEKPVPPTRFPGTVKAQASGSVVAVRKKFFRNRDVL